MTTYLLKHPEQARRTFLPCQWYGEVPLNRECSPNSISIVEGGRGGFMEPGNRRKLYLKFQRANLKGNFSAKKFFKRLKKLFRFRYTIGDYNQEEHEENIAFEIIRGFLNHMNV